MTKDAKKQTEKIIAAVANADWDAPQSIGNLRLEARASLAQWQILKAQNDRMPAQEFMLLLVKLGQMAETTLLLHGEGAAP